MGISQRMLSALPQRMFSALPQRMFSALPQRMLSALPQRMLAALPQRMLSALPQRMLAALPQRMLFALPQRMLAALPQRMLSALPQRMLAALPQRMLSALPQRMLARVTPEDVGRRCPRGCCPRYPRGCCPRCPRGCLPASSQGELMGLHGAVTEFPRSSLKSRQQSTALPAQGSKLESAAKTFRRPVPLTNIPSPENSAEVLQQTCVSAAAKGALDDRGIKPDRTRHDRRCHAGSGQLQACVPPSEPMTSSGCSRTSVDPGARPGPRILLPGATRVRLHQAWSYIVGPFEL